MKVKNKTFSILLISMGVMTACSQAETAETVTEAFVLPAGAETFAYEGDPDHMRAVVKEGENILSEGDLKQGLRHGSWATYDATGALSSLETYYEGKKQGITLIFDNQGYVASKAYYHRDKLDGEYKAYKRKKVVEERSYENGVLEGIVRKYYENGQLMEEAPYVNGKLDGLAKWYDQEGNLSIAYLYEEGELVDKDPQVEED